MKNIVICGPYPGPIGGVSIHIMRLCFALKGEFNFIVVDESPLRKYNIFNLRGFNFYKYFSILFVADLVHVNSSIPLFRFVHVLFGRIIFRKPVLLTVHSYRKTSFFNKILNLFSFYFSSKIIAVSSEVYSNLKFQADIIPAFVYPSEDEFLIPNEFVELINKIKIGKKRLVVSNAYSLSHLSGVEMYGFRDLIELFKDVEVRKSFSIILNVSSIAGCADVFNKYLSFIKENNLEDSVFLFYSQLSFVGLLKYADTFIRATITDGDALSIRESLLLGVNTIASDCVGRPDGVNIYKTRDLESLKHVLLKSTIQKNATCVSFEYDISEVYKKLT